MYHIMHASNTTYNALRQKEAAHDISKGFRFSKQFMRGHIPAKAFRTKDKMATPSDSAFLLVQKLRNQHYTIRQNARNPAVMTDAFCTISQSVSEYFTLSHQVEQSAKIQESMETFCWLWVELPQFPLRRCAFNYYCFWDAC